MGLEFSNSGFLMDKDDDIFDTPDKWHGMNSMTLTELKSLERTYSFAVRGTKTQAQLLSETSKDASADEVYSAYLKLCDVEDAYRPNELAEEDYSEEGKRIFFIKADVASKLEELNYGFYIHASLRYISEFTTLQKIAQRYFGHDEEWLKSKIKLAMEYRLGFTKEEADITVKALEDITERLWIYLCEIRKRIDMLSADKCAK